MGQSPPNDYKKNLTERIKPFEFYQEKNIDKTLKLNDIINTSNKNYTDITTMENTIFLIP